MMIVSGESADVVITDSSTAKSGGMRYENNVSSGNNSVILCKMGANVRIDGGEYEIYAERAAADSAVIRAEGGKVTITDGKFDARSGFGIHAVKLVHPNFIFAPPSCEIYGGKFYAVDTLLFAGSQGSYLHLGVPYPYFYVMGGEFYLSKKTDRGGFAYCNNGWGEVIVAGGYVPKKNLNNDITYVDGATFKYESYALENESVEYRIVTPPPVITSGLANNVYNRLRDLCYKKHCEMLYEIQTLRDKMGEKLLEGIKGVATITVGNNDIYAPQLCAEYIKNGDSIAWYVADENVYGDGEGFVPWVEFADYRNQASWKYPKRIEEKIDCYVKMVVTHSDGKISEDIVCIRFEEMTKLIGGYVLFTNGSVKYGETLTAVIFNEPEYQKGAEYEYRWMIDGRLEGTDRDFTIDSTYYVGKKIQCIITSPELLGELCSVPLTVGKGENNADPKPPTFKYYKGGIDFSNFSSDQEYIFSRKSDKSLLTEADWENAESPRSSEGGYSLGYLGISDLEGKTVYVYTRMKETSYLEVGNKVICIPLVLGSTVNLTSLMFDGIINNTIYIPYTGYGDVVEITYKTDPVNANVWNSFSFRAFYPVSIVSPTDKVTVGNNTGKLQLKLMSTGSTTLTASYYTNSEVYYANVNVVVYDPLNPSIGWANVATPMEDQKISVGQTMTVKMPQIVPAPPADMDIKWYLSRSTKDGVVTFTENEVARIDPETGLIVGLSPGVVNVSLMAPSGEIDMFTLTVTEPDGKLPVSQVYVTYDKLTLKENSSTALGVRIYPENATEKKVTWSSSAPSVAKVDANGWITAISSGVAVITAEVDGVSATCTVTVIPDGFEGGILGDLNYDGKVNARDKALLTSYIKAGESPAIADLNGDGKVNARDKAEITAIIKG